MGTAFAAILVSVLAVTGAVMLLIFVLVPVFKAIRWFIGHIFEFIIGLCHDVIRFAGSLLAMTLLMPLVPLNIVIGRWSAANHFAQAVKRECQVGSACVYRAVLRRPLKLLMLHGLLEGLEQRVPEAVYGAPGADGPGRRVGQFDGYTIIGSLRAGGSGAKLYIAEPDDQKRRDFRNGRLPDRVVIKCFALTEGSSLPQIVRESRALECAKQLGHVLDHGMDEHRFFYVMPYHPGDHLGILTRQMHGEYGGRGLDQRRLNLVMSYTRDLLSTLRAYHNGGLWHKDVKPENVIVHDGKAHLVDLGLVTPLRSAMTLTTHGTEYFRDPEMVRQALRGVKVHQVNGAKFDIYAAGAVLYFMIENTFPAHGGLSRFVTNSPEALRWIVRRAMTEYHQRYSTADQMLGDLEYVARSEDAFAVKPGDLPSMRGSAAMPMDEASESTIGSIAGLQTEGGTQAGRHATGPIPVRGARPRLTITNWWTGRYRAEPSPSDDFEVASGLGHAVRTMRRHASAFRRQAHAIKLQAHEGTIGAGRTAREQIKAARQRAREIRERALIHRQRVVSGARTSPWTVALGAVSLLIITGLVALAFFVAAASSRFERFVVSDSSAKQTARPVILALDAADPADPRLQRELENCIRQQRRKGFDVIIDGIDQQQATLQLIERWRQDEDGPADKDLEEFLAQRNAYGILYVRPIAGRDDVQATVIYSTRPEAGNRLGIAEPIPPAPARPYLLINDHPTKADAQVEASIEQILKAYREQGWMIEVRDDLEVAVRKFLPAGSIDSKFAVPATLKAVLEAAQFGGVLRIESKSGEGPAHQRVQVTQLDADHSEMAAQSPIQRSESGTVITDG